MESTPSTASFKRVRPPGSGNRVPSCSVDGCDADLGKCRDYHRRHKVCELHSKTPNVSIRGQERRFCQQCSRFHSLEEFDEGKRSCRKRLDGHNRRRRKPQPDALSVNSGRLLSNPPGTRYLLFNSPQMFSTTSMTDSSIGAMKVETDLSRSLSFSDRNSSFHGSSSLNYKEEKQVSFLEYASSTVPSVPVCQPLVNANHPSSSNGGRCQEMFSSSGLNRSIECNRALSLLSSQPAETLEIGLNPMVQSGTTSSLVPSVQYEGLGMESEQLGTNLTTNGSTNTNLHGNGVFRTRHPGSSATATQHALSFSWE